jgi:acyl-CoA synthetase (AMP-forming)/AMP-acid ligase II
MHCFSAPESTSTTMTGKSVYSGDLTLDVTKGSDGMYYLYDQQRNIHTLVGAYLPSFQYLFESGRMFDYFPRYDLTDEDIQTQNAEKIRAWYIQLYADYAANNLPGLEEYITDHAYYMPNQGDTWTAYHLKSLTMSDNTLELDEDSYLTVTGRLKRVIKLAGHRTSLDEIDALVMDELNILSASVGTDDHLCVFVTSEADNALVRDFLFKTLSAARAGLRVLTIPAFPKNEGGKILYAELQKRAEE